MACLDDQDCKSIRDTLTGLARDVWTEIEPEVRTLTYDEARYVASTMVHEPYRAADAVVRTWGAADLLAAMRSHEKSLRNLNERAANRMDLAAKLLDLAPDVVRVIGRVLWGRLSP